MVALVFIGGNELRAAEIRRIAPDLELAVTALQTGFSTSAPEPAQRARDQLLAHPLAPPAIAEAVDLTTMAGKSLRLELESENENRFCKWWRETPAQMHVAVALRRAADGEIMLFTAICDGQIASQPAGSRQLGWDRLFVPAGEEATLAELIDAGEVIGFRRDIYAQVARALKG